MTECNDGHREIYYRSGNCPLCEAMLKIAGIQLVDNIDTVLEGKIADNARISKIESDLGVVMKLLMDSGYFTSAEYKEYYDRYIGCMCSLRQSKTVPI